MGDFTQPQLNLLHLVKIAFCNRCQFLPCPKNFSKFFVHIIWVCKHSDFFFKSHPGTLSLATTIYDLERSVILAHRGGIIRQVFLGFMPPQGVKFRKVFFSCRNKSFHRNFANKNFCQKKSLWKKIFTGKKFSLKNFFCPKKFCG